jgi:hypothetical protein
MTTDVTDDRISMTGTGASRRGAPPCETNTTRRRKLRGIGTTKRRGDQSWAGSPETRSLEFAKRRRTSKAISAASGRGCEIIRRRAKTKSNVCNNLRARSWARSGLFHSLEASGSLANPDILRLPDPSRTPRRSPALSQTRHRCSASAATQFLLLVTAPVGAAGAAN